MQQSLKAIQDEHHGIPGAPAGQKRSNKGKATPEKIVPISEKKGKDTDPGKLRIDRQINSIEMTQKGKVIIFVESEIVHPIRDGQDLNTKNVVENKIKADYEPHQDFINAMKALRRHALNMLQMEEDTPTAKLSEYTVSKVKISGDYLLKKSRVTLTLAKKYTIGESTGVKKIETGDVVMYGDSGYDGIEKLTQQVEKVIEEAWAYARGTKRGEVASEEGGQIALFQ